MVPATRSKRRRSDSDEPRKAPPSAESSKAPTTRSKLRSAKSGKAPAKQRRDESPEALPPAESSKALTTRSRVRFAKSDGKAPAKRRDESPEAPSSDPDEYLETPSSDESSKALYSAKSASAWGAKDLDAYNIKIQFQDAATFFGSDPLPQPSVSNELLTTADMDDMTISSNYKLLWCMNRAMTVQEPAVDAFAIRLLTDLGYTSSRTRNVVPRVHLRLDICKEKRYAIPNITVMETTNDVLLLIQEDKRLGGRKDPEPQLIAQAIAVFQDVNRNHTENGGEPIDVKVSEELAQAVKLGKRPASQTIIYAHQPAVPRPNLRLIEGMKPLDNRNIILSCFEAFKQFLLLHVKSVRASMGLRGGKADRPKIHWRVLAGGANQSHVPFIHTIMYRYSFIDL